MPVMNNKMNCINFDTLDLQCSSISLHPAHVLGCSLHRSDFEKLNEDNGNLANLRFPQTT